MNCELALASCNLSDHDVAFLAKNRFEDEDSFYREARTRFSSVYLLQTCGRIEILVHGKLDELKTFLENAGKSKVVILDKTGTITKGEPSITSIHSLKMDEVHQLLQMCLSISVNLPQEPNRLSSGKIRFSAR